MVKSTRSARIWAASAGLALFALGCQAANGQDIKAPRPDPPQPAAPQGPIGFPLDADGELQPPPDNVKTEILPSDFELSLDQAIALLEKQLKERPKDFVLHTNLGRLYEEKGGVGGDLAYFAKAEAAFRKVIADAPKYRPAQLALAGVLCDRHQFAESLEMAETLLKDSPKSRDALIIKGDCQLELGQFAEAERAYKLLGKLYYSPNILARLARIAELKGDLSKSAKLLAEAAGFAAKSEDPESAAWYVLRLGDLARNQGQWDQAAQYYESILKTIPKYHDALFNLGQVRAAQDRNDEALDLVRQAIAIGAEPHMLAFLGDLLTKMGKKSEADTAYQKIMETAAKEEEYRREVALFLCDHDRDLPMALELAQADMGTRKDIAAYDALAWALFKNGKTAEAVEPMKTALSLGTKDARMFYHGALILNELGYKERAREYLDMALNLNPKFSLLHAESAEKLRDSLPKRQ